MEQKGLYAIYVDQLIWGSNKLEGFVDSDWASCNQDRRSYTGYVFTLGNGAVTWETKKQQTVALSTTEAEYMGLTESTKEPIYLTRFLKEIGFWNQKIVELYNDNQGAQRLAKNPIHHSRTKHIDIRHHFIRDAIQRGMINIKYMESAELMADVLTKALPESKYQNCLVKFGLRLL